jgi:hypothetical protein
MVWAMVLPHAFAANSMFSYLFAYKSQCNIRRHRIAELLLASGAPRPWEPAEQWSRK